MRMGNKIYTSDQLYDGKTIEKYINVFSMVVTDQMELAHTHIFPRRWVVRLAPSTQMDYLSPLQMDFQPEMTKLHE